MKSKKSLFCFLLLCFASSAAMAQTTLEKLLMKVTLGHDGSARVIERRQVQVGEQGTEGYITFNNMPDMEVCDLQVYDETDSLYVVEEKWDTQRSRAQKKGRCGYNRTSTGVELCWGLGDAGERTYDICYTITNLVKAYDDYDGFCHSFYEAAGSPPKKAYLEIICEDDSLTKENTAIWAFGYNGYKGLEDGYCYAYNDTTMGDHDQIIILLQLEKGLLEPALTLDQSFKETVKRQALEGSEYNLEDAGLGEAGKSSLAGGLNKEEEPSGFDSEGMAATFCVGAIVAFILFVRRKEKKKQKKEMARVNALLSGLMDASKLEDVPYYRNLPIGGNLLKSGATLSTLNVYADACGQKKLNLSFNLQHMFEAFVLRMIYKKQVKVIFDDTEGRQLFRISEPVKPEKSDDITSMLCYNKKYRKSFELEYNEALKADWWAETKQVYQGYINDAGIEYHLQKLLFDASAADHILQPNELKQYVKDNPMQWRPFANMLNRLTGGVIDEAKLNGEDAKQVVGFLRYLQDFSLVGERHMEEVGLWKEYLVFASFYGIADQVRKDMKKVAPDVTKLGEIVPPEELFDEITPLTNALTSSLLFAQAYMTYKEKKEVEAWNARDRASDYSSSSGWSGSSSYSGGGGHTGGGGSGFR